MTNLVDGYDDSTGFLLTRPSRDVTEPVRVTDMPDLISTHTSLAGRDNLDITTGEILQNFYSHVPRGT